MNEHYVLVKGSIDKEYLSLNIDALKKGNEVYKAIIIEVEHIIEPCNMTGKISYIYSQ